MVTGAGSGIGRAAAALFAREGAAVAVVDLDADAAKDAAEEITAAGGTALAVAANVADRLQVAALSNRSATNTSAWTCCTTTPA